MSTESTLATITDPSALSLGNASQFDHIQRVAKMFAESQLVPVTFQKNLPNCVIALEMAQRIHASPMMLMQNLNIIHGKPSFGSSFMIASVNSCGRFSPLRFVYVGTEGQDDWGCYAVATAKLDQAECRGVTVTIAIAKAEGWVSKNGSKWKTMPQLMLSYRAATWWARMFAPELLMGFQTYEEVVDVAATPVVEPTAAATTTGSITGTRGKKGVSAMRDVTPKAEDLAPAPAPTPDPAAPTTTTPSTPQPDPAPAAPAPQEQPAAAATPAASEPTPLEDPEPDAEPKTQRYEIKTIIERDAKVQGKPAKVCEVELSGSAPTDGSPAIAKAYFNGPAGTFPGAGTIIDAVISSKPYKGALAHIIEKYEVVGG